MTTKIIHNYDGNDQTMCGLDSLLGSTLIQSRVNCIDCLIKIKQEWQFQVDNFKGHPLENAKVGLAKTQKQIDDLEMGSLQVKE